MVGMSARERRPNQGIGSSCERLGHASGGFSPYLFIMEWNVLIVVGDDPAWSDYATGRLVTRSLDHRL